MSAPGQAAALAPNRDEAREWASDELSKQEYQEADLTLLQRLGRAISDALDRLFSSATGVESPWLVIPVILVVLALIALIVWRVRRGSGGSLSDPRRSVSLLVPGLDPQEMRARAAVAARARDWNLAVQESVRALLADLDQAGAIEIGAASTASELTRAAAAARPAEAPDLRAAGTLFDSVTFGEGSAAESDYRWITALDERLHTVGSDTERPHNPVSR